MGKLLRGWNLESLFEGRATRREFWPFALVYLGALVGAFFDTSPDTLPIAVPGTVPADESRAMLILQRFCLGYILVGLIPFLGLCARRLHDCGYSGRLLGVLLLPCIGPIFALGFIGHWLEDGDPFANKYGPDPKGRGGKHGIEPVC